MKATVFWITGLPGAGKTTLARTVVEYLKGNGVPTVWLDGDALRNALGVSSRHDRAGRFEMAQSYARLAGLFVEQEFSVVVSTVSLFHDIHAANRTMFDSYLEVFLEVDPVDSKSGPRAHLYSLEEELNPFIAFEKPIAPHISLSTCTSDQSNWSSTVTEEIRSRFL
jgi:adenylylsulfate kinase